MASRRAHLPPPGRPVMLGAVFRGFPAFALATLVERYVPPEAWARALVHVRPEDRDATTLAMAELMLAAEQARDLLASQAAVRGSAAGLGAAAARPSVHEVSTERAAVMLGVTANRVRQMCRAGVLEARKVGSVWLVDVAGLRLRAVA